MDDYCGSITCPLYGKRIVKGSGPIPTFGMICGESAGEEEAATGQPFVGRSGQELTQYMTRAELSRNMWRIENVVSCHPDGNKTTDEMVNCCKYRLINQILECQPKFIAAVGSFSTRFFLGPVSLEYVHGIPYTIDKLADGTSIPQTTVIPCYHPALGLRKTEMMSHTQMDFYAIADTIKGKITPRRIDQYANRQVDYRLVTDPREIEFAPRVAIDTEWAKGKPWCITWSIGENMARMVMADNQACLARLREWWEDPDVECDIHNALYDVPVLWQLGINPKKVVDTMVMAYLLQTEPQGLKPLVYRYFNIKMTEYKKVVGAANQMKAMDYLTRVYFRNWPDPEPIERWVNNELKPKYPSNIRKRVKKILTDMYRAHDRELPEVDLYDRWYNVKDVEGREGVEEVLGKMEQGDLSDIEFDRASQYAMQDADVLYMLKPMLWEKIQAMKLEDVFWTDMGIIPMVSDMMVKGTKIDIQHFKDYSEELNERMDFVQYQIDEMAGRHVNPKSWIQVLNILMDRGTFKYPQSTNEEHLSKVKEADPLISLILKYRGLSKLKTTYSDPIPKLADENHRVHTIARTTTTATGRLAFSRPNLTNIPTKTEDGKKIRKGFICEPGNIIIAADFSQIELRILAHVSQDENMLECYARGDDLHMQTAKEIFMLGGGTEEEWKRLSKEEKSSRRRLAKSCNFGISYGLTEFGLQADLATQGIFITLDEAKRFIDSWFFVRPGVYRWLDMTKAEARRTGMVRDLFGRMRLCPEGYSADEWIKRAGERQAINTPIQSGAQGVVKRAMVQLTPYYQEFNNNPYGHVWWPLIQIHDDIRSEVTESMVYPVACIKKSVMENAVKLDIPTPVEIKVGYNWKEMGVLEL